MIDTESNTLISLLHARSETQREIHARAEHLRILSRHAIFVLLGNLAGSLTLGIGLSNTAEPGILYTWVSAMILFNVARWMIGRRFPKDTISEAETIRWEKGFVISVAVSGLLWGSAGILFYLPGSPEHGLFLALIIVGMCAATTASLSYHRFAYPVFLIPAITPITLNLMSDSSLAANTIGYILPFYFVLMYLLSKEIYQTAHQSILGRINSQHLAMFDYLTGVANRRTFEETLNREWYRAMREKQTLSLIIADIDDFKRCNDRYGHAIGDQALQAAAKFIEKRTRRGTDLVARIGGEEFAIILPDTDLDGAVMLAENIRQGMHNLPHSYYQEMPKITLCLGVSGLVPNEAQDVSLLFRAADKAVYRAKEKGKDRVETIILQ